VTALRRLVTRPDADQFFVNLPYELGDQWQRRIAFRVDWSSVEARRDPVVVVTEERNGTPVRSGRVQVSEVFDLLPNLRKVLARINQEG
jgi:hypothetical protein